VDLKAFFERRSVRDPPSEAVLIEMNKILLPARRHFGYRTAGEILSFVAQAGPGADPVQRFALLDQAVYAKVLPRIRGEMGKELKAALDALRGCCENTSLRQSADKIALMADKLAQQGITHFWS
jgi:hypothetical protein